MSSRPVADFERLPVEGPGAFTRWQLAVRAAGPVLRVVGISIAGSAVLYAINRGTVSNDDYAFLDWGRQLLHGSVPMLGHRAFHPLPVAAGALLSLFGFSAPTIIELTFLAFLVSLAVAGWRLAALLGLRQPAPALAGALIVINPALVLIGYSAYINLPFAALVVWALVMELERRAPWTVWTLLIAGGLVRPEGWAFLSAYGALQWWRARQQGASVRQLGAIAALCVGPAMLWLGIEWALFGDPLYSFSSARDSVATTDISGLQTFEFAFGVPLLVLCAIGICAIAWLAPRREAAFALATAGLGILTLAFLVLAGVNVPSRHFSLLIALMCVFVAAGVVAPATLVERRRTLPSGWRVGLALATSAVVGIAAPHAIHRWSRVLPGVRLTGSTEATLAREVHHVRSRIDVDGAREDAVVLVGSPLGAPLAYDLGVRYDVVITQPSASAHLIVQPSLATWNALHRAGVDDLPLMTPPPGWQELASGPWEIYAPPGTLPVRLG